MKKLIELFNKRVIEKWLRDDEIFNWEEDVKENILYLPNLKSFVKWLVENDKINRERFWNSETKSSKYSDFELSYDTPREDYTNILLMELSISDTPIDDLVSYLK